MASFLAPLVRSPHSAFALVNELTGGVVAGRVLGAFDMLPRMKGLLGRKSLDPDTALVIAPTNAIHTWFMRFPIDVAFVARDGGVVKIRHRMGPWRMSAAFQAFAAVELAASALESSETAVGDRLLLRAGAPR